MNIKTQNLDHQPTSMFPWLAAHPWLKVHRLIVIGAGRRQRRRSHSALVRLQTNKNNSIDRFIFLLIDPNSNQYRIKWKDTKVQPHLTPV